MPDKYCRCRGRKCNQILSNRQRERHYRAAAEAAALTGDFTYAVEDSAEEDSGSSVDRSSSEPDNSMDICPINAASMSPGSEGSNNAASMSSGSEDSDNEDISMVSSPLQDDTSSGSEMNISAPDLKAFEFTATESNDWLSHIFEKLTTALQNPQLEEIERGRNNILTTQDRNNIRGFKILMCGITRKAFAQMRHSFGDKIRIDSEYVILHRIATLTEITPKHIDCCINSCVAYTRDYAGATNCPYCNEKRYSPSGVPRRIFRYIPLIPQLQGLYKSTETSKLLRYRSNFEYTAPTLIKDVFDGQLYRNLIGAKVVVDGQEQKHRFFSRRRDIALSSCTDGFLLFQRNRSGPTATPILLQNLNLPPTIRTHAENLICTGVIPGPRQPKDLASFMAPLDDELAQLAYGVQTYDAYEEEIFTLHGYQIFNAGDIVAIEKNLGIKGHSSLCPCRNCKLSGIRNLGEGGKIYYIPLKMPTNISAELQDNTGRDPLHLPMRTHDQFIQTADKLDNAKSLKARNDLAKKVGIKGLPVFRRVQSLDYAKSFPWDWMHLLLENVIPNMMDLWMGRYKGLDTGTEDYEILPEVWKVIAQETIDATSHIPVEFVRVQKDLITQRSSWTAESYCFWFCYLMPILLKGRFQKSKYYRHTLLLVKIMKTSLQFAITEDELNDMQSDIVQWVKEYEKYYYQYNESRLSTCVLTIHGLLHLVDDIKRCGPSWTTWTFFMERFCGSLKRALRSKSHPWANLSNRCLHLCYIHQLQKRYTLGRELEDVYPNYRRLPSNHLSQNEVLYDRYPDHIVSTPRRENSVLTHTQHSKICEYIHGVVNTGVGKIGKLLPHTVCLWGKVRLGRSARVHSEWAEPGGEPQRDASYIRYEFELMDKQAVVPIVGYGKLVSIMAVKLPCNTQVLGALSNCELLLVLVKPCQTKGKDARKEITSYSSNLQPLVLDMKGITAVVGRIKAKGQWHIVDRFDDCALASFEADGEAGHEDDEEEYSD